MIKKLFISLFISFFIFTGCSENQETAKSGSGENRYEEIIDISYGSAELEAFLGEWIIKSLAVTSRVALVEEEYAKSNSNILGKNLSVSENAIVFDSKKYMFDKSEMYDEADFMERFNIAFGEAAWICGGTIDLDTMRSTGVPVKVIMFKTENGEESIKIVVRDDESLLLWIGMEHYEYIGFYILEKT